LELLPKRNPDPSHQSVRLPVMKRQLAAMRQRDRAGDGEAEAEACGVIHVAGIVAAHERLQHLALEGVRNAGTIVFDIDDRAVRRQFEADRGFGAEPDRIVHEIADAAVQIVRTRMA
jgi:hypothetical protein